MLPTEPKEDRQPNSPHLQLPRSYASIFKDAANTLKKGTLRFIPSKYNELGISHAVIPDDLLAKQNEWLLTLVGHFIGKRPAFQFVRFHANRLWKQFGLVNVILNDQGYFYFKFRDDQGMKHVLENGPWLFNDIPVLLGSWQPGMWFDKPKPTEVPLCVNIYDIPVSLWSYDILIHIVSVIGKPIAVDRYTADMCEKKTGRAVFARILVEISADHEIPQFVDAIILGTMRRFRLQYHWTPARCSHCKIFGHKFVECPERPRTTEEMEVRMQNAAPSNKVGLSGTKDQDFQQSKKRRRSPKKAQTTTAIHVTNDKPKVPKVTQTEKSKSDSQAIDNNQTSDTSIPSRIPSMDTLAPDTHLRTK